MEEKSEMDYREEGKWQIGELAVLKINPFAFQLFEVQFKFSFQWGTEGILLDHHNTTKPITKVSNFVRLFKTYETR